MGTLHPSAASSASSPHTPDSASSPIQELVPSGAFAFCNPPEPDLKEIVKIILRKVLKLPEEEEGLPTPPPSLTTPLPPAPATSPAESWIAFSGGFALGFSTGTGLGTGWARRREFSHRNKDYRASIPHLPPSFTAASPPMHISIPYEQARKRWPEADRRRTVQFLYSLNL